MADTALTRPVASAAVEALGWRFLMNGIYAAVEVCSIEEAAEVAATAARLGSPSLRIDLRAHRVELSLQTHAVGVTQADVDVARAVTAALGRHRIIAASGAGHPVQVIEIAIDALDIPAITPFWKAVLAYVERGAPDDLVDPAGVGPTIWFQQMDAARPQRNRIHVDIAVAHDEADGRLAAALAAGGVLLDASSAPAFWVVADPEGNEICICTWQGRD